MAVEQPKEEEKDSDEKETEKKDDKPSAGESSALQQAERAKAALIGDKGRIYQKGKLCPIVSSLIGVSIVNFESLICQPILPTMIKAKLYELLSAFIQVEQPIILMKILASKVLNYLIIDFDKYENNSNILLLLSNVIKSIMSMKTNPKLGEKVLFDLKLIKIFSSKLNHRDYQES